MTLEAILEEYNIPSAVDLFLRKGSLWLDAASSDLRRAGYGYAALYPSDEVADVSGLKAKRLTSPEGLIPLPSAFRANGDMSDVGLMAQAGEKLFCVPEGFEDIARLRRFFCYASDFGVRIALVPTVKALCEKGQINEGDVADVLGMKGFPPSAELIAVQTALALADEWKMPLHLRGLTSADSIDAVSKAQERGQDVTCDVTIANLLYDESIYTVMTLTPALKLYPPLRTKADKEALWAAIESGVVTAVVSNYCPRSEDELALPFEEVPFGSEKLAGCLSELFNGWEELGRPCSIERLMYVLSEGPRKVSGITASGRTVLRKTRRGWSSHFERE